MSTFDPKRVATRLTLDRLGSYLVAAGGNVAEAVELYDWRPHGATMVPFR